MLTNGPVAPFLHASAKTIVAEVSAVIPGYLSHSIVGDPSSEDVGRVVNYSKARSIGLCVSDRVKHVRIFFVRLRSIALRCAV